VTWYDYKGTASQYVFVDLVAEFGGEAAEGRLYLVVGVAMMEISAMGG
jgi:hypothetical protein